MLFKHAEIFTPQGFVRGAFTVEDGRFGEILPQSPDMPGTDLGGALEEVARQLDIPFLDAAKVTLPSKEDSLHLTKEGHLALAKALAKKVKEILE